MFKISKFVELRETKDGALLLDTRRGTYWHLNETGLRLFRAIRAGRSVDEVAIEVARQHNVESNVVKSDLDALVSEMRHARLIVRR